MIVLDTHAVVWWLAGSPRLSRRALSAIRREDAIAIPAICTWELSLLALRGRVPLSQTVPAVFAELLGQPRVSLQPLTPEIGYRAAQLSPTQPMDPADQLIAATAITLNAPLVTSDERLHAIPGLRILW